MNASCSKRMADMTTTIIVEKLKTAFADDIQSVQEFRGETTVYVKPAAIVTICAFLKDLPDAPFDYLVDVCGADNFTAEGRFEVIYNIYSLRTKIRMRLKTRVEENSPRLPSVTSVWPGADWPERETYDMFGIEFTGHPDLRRIYMPEEYAHYPLRKDFPVMGIPDSIPLPRK